MVFGRNVGSGLMQLGLAAVVCAVALFSSSSAALAQSCEDVDSVWGGGGLTMSTFDEVWFEVNLAVGDRLTYTVTSSGSTNAPNNMYSGAGFALYSYTANHPTDHVIVEGYAHSGAEIAHGPGATYTVPETGPYVIYAWGGSGSASINAQVTCAPAPPAPAITVAPTNKSVNVGGDTAFTVGATDASGYQWQVNSGSGFSSVANGGVYSGATTPTLAITGATAGMNGYMYRAVVSGPTAPNVTSTAATLTVSRLAQAITFDDPGAQIFGTGPTLSATTDSSLPVSFSSATPGVCTTTTAGELTFLTAGICTINANQSGNGTYDAAPQVQQSFEVTPVAPGVPTGIVATAGDTQASVAFIAPASNGGSAISSYTVTASPGGATGTGASSPITVTGLSNGTAYTFTVSATTSAGSGPESAASASVAPKGSQTITFPQPLNQNFGTTPTIGATSSSGLAVTFSSSSTGVCTITGQGQLAFEAAGTCIIDADQAGDAAFYAAQTVSRSFNVQPVLPSAPTIGTATAGEDDATVSFTAPASDGGSAITGYTATANPGGITSTGASSPVTISGLTRGVAYTFTVTATNGVGTGSASAASNSVIPADPQTIIFSNPGTQNFGTTPTLTATATSFLTVTFTSSTIGVCTVDGSGVLTFVTAGTCTINANQAGDSSYRAAPEVSRTFTVAPVVPGAPVIGTATAGEGEASVAFTAPANTGGIAITGYTVVSTPGNVTASGAASPIAVTGLQNDTVYTFTVTATNAAGSGNPSAPSNSVTPMPPPLPPVVGAVSATVAANSTDNAITLDVSSTVPVTLSIATPASHGTATVSGQSITYTPTAGYSGSDAFAYAATNSAGTSVSAVVTITVTAPPAPPTIGSITPDEKMVTDNMVYTTITGTGLATTQSVVFGVVRGTDLTVVSDTEISIITPHNIPGVYDVTVNTANGSVTSTAAFTVNAPISSPTISLAASDVDPSFGTSVTFTATLAAGSSPTGTVTFKDGTDTLGTGAISGTAATFVTDTLGVGAHSITAEYGGDAGNAAAVSNALVVTVAAPAFTFSPPGGALAQAMAGEDYSQSISASGGSGSLTYSVVLGTLPKGMVLNVSTGEITGPSAEDAEVKDYTFTIQARDGSGTTGTAIYTLEVMERAVTVTNKQIDVPAGTAPNNVDLTSGATGGPFISAEIVTVEPANAGAVLVVRGEFAQLGGPDELGWYLKFVPNPAYSGQVSIRFRLTSALGISNAGTIVYTLRYDPGQVAADIDGLVRGYVRSRQNMIANTVHVPGLLERRQMSAASEPVTARLTPSESGVATNFSTSLAQMEAASGTGEEGQPTPFNLWIDGTFLMHNRDQNGSRWGSFAMVSAGVDYLISPRALVGLSVHYDQMTDPTDANAELTGKGWLAGPYASLEIGTGVFWDTSLLFGGSANDIGTAFWDGSFDTSRLLFDTSVAGQWHLDHSTIVTPRLRAIYFSETVDGYAVENGSGDVLEMQGFTEEQFRVSLGAEIARRFTLENGMAVSPKIGLTGGFSGLDGSGAFGQVAVGLALDTPTGLNVDFGLRLNLGGDGEKSVGARAGVRKRF